MCTMQAAESVSSFIYGLDIKKELWIRAILGQNTVIYYEGIFGKEIIVQFNRMQMTLNTEGKNWQYFHNKKRLNK